MTFPVQKPGGWTNNTDTITGTQITNMDANLALAVDGSGGGTYSPTAKISIQGTTGLEFAGTGVAAYPRLSSRTLDIDHQLSLACVVQNVGPSSNVPSGQLADGDVTASIGGLTVASGCIISPAAAVNATQASYMVLEIVRPPDMATITQAVIRTKGVSAAPALVTPKYTMVTWTAGGVLTAISTVDIADTHVVGDWTTTVIAQTISATASTVVDTVSDAGAQKRYGILVKNPYDAGGTSFRIYSLTCRYTVTNLGF